MVHQLLLFKKKNKNTSNKNFKCSFFFSSCLFTPFSIFKKSNKNKNTKWSKKVSRTLPLFLPLPLPLLPSPPLFYRAERREKDAKGCRGGCYHPTTGRGGGRGEGMGGNGGGNRGGGKYPKKNF
jgi:hypothetical protein